MKRENPFDLRCSIWKTSVSTSTNRSPLKKWKKGNSIDRFTYTGCMRSWGDGWIHKRLAKVMTEILDFFFLVFFGPSFVSDPAGIMARSDHVHALHFVVHWESR